MKKLNKKQEFEKMQKMYDNCTGLKDKMDFATFTFKYYDDMIKKYEELREYWGSTEWHKFMEEAAVEKPAEEKKETPEDEIARLKAKIAELEAAKPQPDAQPVEKKKRVIVVRKKPAVSQ